MEGRPSLGSRMLCRTLIFSVWPLDSPQNCTFCLCIVILLSNGPHTTHTKPHGWTWNAHGMWTFYTHTNVFASKIKIRFLIKSLDTVKVHLTSTVRSQTHVTPCSGICHLRSPCICLVESHNRGHRITRPFGYR